MASPPQKANTTTGNQGVSQWALILAPIMWIYIVVNSFFVSIDALIINYFPYSNNFLLFKYVVLLVSLVFVFFKYKGWQRSLIIMYIFFYPMIFIFWQVPSFLFKRNMFGVIVAYLWSIITFLASLKQKILDFTLFILGVTFTLVNNDIVNIFGIFFFLIFIGRHLISRISGSINPLKIFTKNTDDLVRSIRKETSFETDFSKGEEDKAKYQINYNLTLFYIGSLGYLRRNIHNMHRSKIFIWVFSYGMAQTLFLVIISFTFINYGLYNINQSFFSTPNGAILFDFFYYSLFSVVAADVDDVIAISNISQIFRSLEFIICLIMLAAIANVYYASTTERYNSDLEKISNAAEARYQELSVKLNTVLQISFSEIKEDLKSQRKTMGILLAFMDGNTQYTIRDVIDAFLENNKIQKDTPTLPEAKNNIIDAQND